MSSKTLINPPVYKYNFGDQSSLITLHWLRNVQTHRFLIRPSAHCANLYINDQTGERRLFPEAPPGWSFYTKFDHVTGLFIERPEFSNTGGDQQAFIPLLIQVSSLIGFVDTTAANFVNFYLGDKYKNEFDIATKRK